MFPNEFYYMSMKKLFNAFIERGYTIENVHGCVSRMAHVIHYCRCFHKAETAEGCSLAIWSRDEARKDLDAYMHAHCFDDDMKSAVRYLITHINL